MKDFIYAITTTNKTVAQGNIIPLTTIARKPCCSVIDLINNGLIFKKAGYYKISGTITFTGTAGVSTIQAYKDSLPVPALLTSMTTEAATVYTLTLDGIIRVYCGEQPAVITLVNTGVQAAISNVSVVAEYLN